MSHSLTAPQTGRKTPTSVYNVAVSLDLAMEEGLSLVGTPVLTVSPVGLTASSPAVTAAAKEILGKSVAAGRAVTFVASGGTAGTTYQVKVSCQNDADPAETVEGYVNIVVAES